MSNTIAVDKEKLEEEAKKKYYEELRSCLGDQDEQIRNKPVKITCIDYRWFYQNNENFIAFTSLLSGTLPTSFYSSTFIDLQLD